MEFWKLSNFSKKNLTNQCRMHNIGLYIKRTMFIQSTLKSEQQDFLPAFYDLINNLLDKSTERKKEKPTGRKIFDL